MSKTTNYIRIEHDVRKDEYIFFDGGSIVSTKEAYAKTQGLGKPCIWGVCADPGPWDYLPLIGYRRESAIKLELAEAIAEHIAFPTKPSHVNDLEAELKRLHDRFIEVRGTPPGGVNGLIG